MNATTRDRIGAATGAAFVALIFVGNGMATSGQSGSSHPSGEAVLRDAAHSAASTTATVGFAMEITGFVLFWVFLGYLAHAARRAPADGWTGMAAGTALVGGITMLAVKLASAGSVMALLIDRDTLDPQLAMVLNDINGALFVASWLPFAVFVGAAAVALHGAGLLGRPTAYAGAVAGVAGVVLAVHGIRYPLDGIPLAFLLGMLWLLVVSVRLAVRPGTTVAEVPREPGRRATVAA